MLSRTPERTDDTFCSPACGRGCTRAEYDAAAENGATLATRLGDGWTCELWENLCWHYKAVSACGRVKVHPSFAGRFTAFLGKADSTGGKWAMGGATPAEAVENVLEEARGELREFIALVDGLVAKPPCEHCEAPDLHGEE